MRSDAYTKAVLTVIALCLIWLCVLSSAPGVSAQRRAQVASGPPQPVVIVGWGTVGEDGRVSLALASEGKGPGSDPLPVRVMGYPMPEAPLDVRLEYSAVHPMPVGITSIERTGEWDPIRSSVEPEPGRPRPGGP